MKNLYDYEKTQSATVDLPFGAFKNESSPGQQDGTDIVAEHIQDIAYCLFQVLQLAGVVPNSELEDGNNKTQFINALANIGILKHSDKVSYNVSVLVWIISGNDFILYRSQKSNNTDNLTNSESWTKILTIDNKNKINFHVQTNISSGSGSSLPVFCFNSGPVDENGEPALITLSKNTLTLNAPAVCTTAGGEKYTISENISLDISESADGNYNLFYNPETEGLEIYNNKIYIQKSEPDEMQINDIWVDTSVMPYKSYKKISASEKENVKIVPNAVISILSDGGGGVTLSVNKYNIMREIDTLKRNKADIDLANTTPAQSFKDMSVCWGLPDYMNGKKNANVLGAWKTVEVDTLLICTFENRATSYDGQILIKNEKGEVPPGIIDEEDPGRILSIGIYSNMAGLRFQTSLWCMLPKGFSYKPTINSTLGATVLLGCMEYPLKGASN